MKPEWSQRWKLWVCSKFGHVPGSYYYGVTGTYFFCKRCRRCVDHFTKQVVK